VVDQREHARRGQDAVFDADVVPVQFCQLGFEVRVVQQATHVQDDGGLRRRAVPVAERGDHALDLVE